MCDLGSNVHVHGPCSPELLIPVPWFTHGRASMQSSSCLFSAYDPAQAALVVEGCLAIPRTQAVESRPDPGLPNSKLQDRGTFLSTFVCKHLHLACEYIGK